MVLKGKYIIVFCAIIFFIKMGVQAEILFEGYSKVMSSGAHVGYIINRYEWNEKSNQFISTSFLKTNEWGGNITESLKSYSTKDLKPIKYSYAAVVGKKAKTIEAEVLDADGKKNKKSKTPNSIMKRRLVAKVIEDNKKAKQITIDLPEQTIFSSNLIYWILQKPEGLKLNTRYEYEAISEEDCALVKGVAISKDQQKKGEELMFNIQNEFKETKFNSNVTEKGDVLSTFSSVSQISTELVTDSNDAIGKINYSTKIVQDLFGNLPEGKKNALAKSKSIQQSTISPSSEGAAIENEPSKQVSPSSSPMDQKEISSPIPGKQIGIPGGKGIHIKGKGQ